MQPRAMKRDDR
ncbi:Putative protein in type-1 retrotransposable element R1DM, partial [Araneus ventricosus]